MKFHKEDKKYFEDVVFLVEADSYSSLALWESHSTEYLTLPFAAKENEEQVKLRVNWEQVYRGHCLTLGYIDKRPTTVDISYAIINGKKIMFYYGASQLVDHEMIKEWLHHFSLKTIRWDGGTRWAHCDAMNFHLCLDAIEELSKGK